MVCSLALKDNRFGDIDEGFMKASNSSHSFSFKFSRNASGGINHLKSISVNQDNKTFTHQLSKPQLKPYFYNPKTKEYNKIDGQPEDLMPGQIILESKTHALLHQHGFFVKQHQFYEQLEDKKQLVMHAGQLHEQIQKGIKEFEKTEADFIQEPSFSFFGKNANEDPILMEKFKSFKKEAKAFYGLMNNKTIKSEKLIDLSPSLQEYAKLKTEIQESESLLNEFVGKCSPPSFVGR